MTILNLILIHLMIVYVLDISGFVDDGIQPFFRKHFKGQLKSKPWLCSRCQSLWIGLIYILIVGKFTIQYIALCMLLSFLAPITYLMLTGLYDFLVRIFQ
jgi:hypothetical protein